MSKFTTMNKHKHRKISALSAATANGHCLRLTI